MDEYYLKYIKYKSKYINLKQSGGDNEYKGLIKYLSDVETQNKSLKLFIPNENLYGTFDESYYIYRETVYLNLDKKIVHSIYSTVTLQEANKKLELNKQKMSIEYTKVSNNVIDIEKSNAPNLIKPINKENYNIILQNVIKGGTKFKDQQPPTPSSKPYKIPKKEKKSVQVYNINDDYYYINDADFKKSGIMIELKNKKVEAINFNRNKYINENGERVHLDIFRYYTNLEEYCIEPMVRKAFKVLSKFFTPNPDLEEFFKNSNKNIILIDGMNFYNRIFENMGKVIVPTNYKAIEINNTNYQNYQKTYLIDAILQYLKDKNIYNNYKFIITTQLSNDFLGNNMYISSKLEYIVLYIPCRLNINLFFGNTIKDTKEELCKDIVMVDTLNKKINIKSELDDYCIIILYYLFDALYSNIDIKKKPFIVSDDEYRWFSNYKSSDFRKVKFNDFIKNEVSSLALKPNY